MGTQLSLLGSDPDLGMGIVSPGPRGSCPDRPLERTAEISLCLKYRYRLSRRWGKGSAALFVMLNPSTGDDTKDDPTISRCIAFARTWGHQALEIVNLCAFRSSHPDALYDVVDPVGPNNNAIIRETAEAVSRGRGKIIAAWGASVRFDEFAPPQLFGRDAYVLEILRKHGPVWCLGRTASGAPKHPLARGKHRVPDDFQPEPFEP